MMYGYAALRAANRTYVWPQWSWPVTLAWFDGQKTADKFEKQKTVIPAQAGIHG